MTQNLPPPFEDALQDLRITGSVLLHECYVPPWAIAIPEETVIRSMLRAGRGIRVLPFHLVLGGGFNLEVPGHGITRVEAGEVAICPSGSAHRMASGRKVKAVPLAELLTGVTAGARRPDAHEGQGTQLLCGLFLLRAAPLNPLLSALPAVVKIKTRGENVPPMLAMAAQMLTMEVARGQPGSFTASRLLEVFCAEAFAAYVKEAGASGAGWFRALADPVIGRALTAVHREPGAPWTVTSLARAASLSPSRFAARFREVMGHSVMSYVAGWRMTVACRALREGDEGLTEVAARAGYADTAAFSRAFKSLVGESPARWRAACRRTLYGREAAE